MGVSIKFLSINSYNSAKNRAATAPKTQRLTLLGSIIHVFLKQK